MKKILAEVSMVFRDITQPTIQKKISAYTQMKGQYGWSVHQELLMLIRGKMAEEILSERFTKLDATEKDARQRAYHMADNLIMFLLNPLKKAQEAAKFYVNFDEKLKREAAKQARPKRRT